MYDQPAQPQRIALICDRYDPEGGGAERNVSEVAAALADRGHAVTILPGSSRGATGDEPYTVQPFSSAPLKSAGRLAAFRRWAIDQLDRSGFDTSLSMITTVPARVIQPLGGTVRETLQQNIAAEPSACRRGVRRMTQGLNAKRRAMLRFEQQTMIDPRVHRFAALSGYVVEQLERHYGVTPDRVELIPNAVNTPLPPEADRDQRRTAMRQELGIADDQVAYLFSAYNPRLKGAFELIVAWAKLRRAEVNGVLVMTGRTPPRLRRRAARLGLDESIRWVGQTHRMLDHYCAADVTVHPTFYDPASRVVIESLRLGTPAITTRFNGAADLLLGPNGQWRGRVVARPEDTDLLAEAMVELADEHARRTCQAAMRGIETELDFNNHINQLEAALRAASQTSDPPG